MRSYGLVLVSICKCVLSLERYLVEFENYASAEEHYSYLEKVLGAYSFRKTKTQRQAFFPRDSVAIYLDKEAIEYLKNFVKRISVDTFFSSSGRGSNATRSHLLESSTRRADIRKYGGTIAPGETARSTWSWNNGSLARVAIFDTGIAEESHPHFLACEIEERINWTSEPTLFDELGHGTFVSSLVAGSSSECPGSAPGTRLLAHKVFTNDQISYTSWFLDAFNYILYRDDVHVINLSVGGPDFTDEPFVDKVRQLVASGVTVVSAMGNDGPTWGTLNSPADMADVIGVGGIDLKEKGGSISAFSSRGPTRPSRRIKPDIIAPAAGVLGSVLAGSECRAMHGTSVASPSVAGVAALVASAHATHSKRRNPAMIKQCLIETADRIRPKEQNNMPSIFVQGAGKMNTPKAAECGRDYIPHISLFPHRIDLTDCPYFSPLCDQPLTPYTLGGMSFSLTVLNGIDSTFRLIHAHFTPSSEHTLVVEIDPRALNQWFWPWFGEIGITLSLQDNDQQKIIPEATTASGSLSLTIETRLSKKIQQGCSVSKEDGHLEEIVLYINVPIAQAKPRNKRLLWDLTHSMAYPPAFAARDSLRQQADLLDWHGDEPWTNFRSTYQHLIRAGYEIDVLRTDFTCFNALRYGAIIIADPEDEFSQHEIKKLGTDITEKELGLLVLADWHSPSLLDETAFFDDNTQVRWQPAVGGSNIPALNRLLDSFGIAFGEDVFEGRLPESFGFDAHFDSGNALVKLPKKAFAISAPQLKQRKSNAQLRREAQQQQQQQRRFKHKKNTLEPPEKPPIVLAAIDRIVAYGDSGCLDDAHILGGFCWPLLDAALLLLTTGLRNSSIFPDASQISSRASFQSAPPATGLVSPFLAKYSVRLQQEQNGEASLSPVSCRRTN